MRTCATLHVGEENGWYTSQIRQLLLDLQNPRISKCASQREALQKIIEEQDIKLVILAESIVEDGLNPMDRWLVLETESDPKRYTVLEGNRRLAALTILNNSAVLNDLEVRSAVKKRLQALAADFSIKALEPIECFEVAERAEGTSWINQRHTGQNKGRGVVNWEGTATARFRGNDPALQALDLVNEHGELSLEEKDEVADRFPITTLDRLLSTPDVRALIGVEIADGKLKTQLPQNEVIKPLRRIVLDLAKSVVNVTKVKLKEQQIPYVQQLGTDLPDLTKKAGVAIAVEELEEKPVVAAPAKATTPAPVVKKPREYRRTTLIPRDCYLTVSNPKIAEIAKELRKLSLEEYPHAISVLFRVFLEMSVDHHLTTAGISLTETVPGGRARDKNLRTKVEAAIANMITQGVPKNSLDPVKKGIDNSKNPLYIDTLHAYVHSPFYTPTIRELEVAWNNSQAFFIGIWK